jgi:hypothetical protein
VVLRPGIASPTRNTTSMDELPASEAAVLDKAATATAGVHND